MRTQYCECLQQQTSLLLINFFTAAYMQIEIYRYVNSNIMYLFACSKSTKSYSTQFTQLNSLIGFIAFPSFTHSGAYPCPQTSKLHWFIIYGGSFQLQFPKSKHWHCLRKLQGGRGIIVHLHYTFYDCWSVLERCLFTIHKKQTLAMLVMHVTSTTFEHTVVSFCLYAIHK